MKAFAIFVLLIAVTAFNNVLAAPAVDDVRFIAVDVYLNSPQAVAAWQFELDEPRGRMKVVGVENGGGAVFTRAPYYDREAVQRGAADRIIVADFTLADHELLPSGRFRIATVHVMLAGDGEPGFDLNLVTATNYDGRTVDAKISIETPARSRH